MIHRVNQISGQQSNTECHEENETLAWAFSSSELFIDINFLRQKEPKDKSMNKYPYIEEPLLVNNTAEIQREIADHIAINPNIITCANRIF